jgi:hypothetical protein
MDQLELGRLLDRKMGWLCALEYPACVNAHNPMCIGNRGPVAHQAPSHDIICGAMGRLARFSCGGAKLPHGQPPFHAKMTGESRRQRSPSICTIPVVNKRIFSAFLLAAVPMVVAEPSAALPADEIQVYNAEIAEVGQWTFQQHLNYTLRGRTEPEFSGGLIPNHSLNGTPELAYGVTDGWELGFYAPFAVDGRGEFLSNGAKIRTLFVTPHANEGNFFYGINLEFSYSTPKFSETRFAIEVRPILGVRNSDWEFIVNPIVNVGLGDKGQADFLPAVRLARKLGQDFFVGLEHYTELGEIGHFLPLREQQHNLFAVTDFKLGKFDVNLGIGCGLTPGSDRLVAKAIVGYAFPVLGSNNPAANRTLNRPPTARAGFGWAVPDLFATR